MTGTASPDFDMQHYSSFATVDEKGLEKFLTFKVAGERYGCEIINIKEIIGYCKMTRVPLTPGEIQGVINLRGSVLPVINLAKRLGKTSRKPDKKTCIVICGVEDRIGVIEIGFLVDEVDQVVDIAGARIEEPPQFGTDVKVEYIGGMGDIDGSFIVLLNIDEILSVTELSSLISANLA